jgi:prepilin-type N-terminal cleavage/methylation domain-containing protein
MRFKSDRHARGFTLIEIIVTLTITAVLATMIFTYFGKAFLESVTPISRLKKSGYLQKIMQNIMADFSYTGLPKWTANKSYSVNDIVIPISRNGHSYKCKTPGPGGESEPAWKIGSDTADALPLIWADNGQLLTLTVSSLKTRINTSGYYKSSSSDPDYVVISNKCIQFDPTTNEELASEDVSCTYKTLKVTLQSDSGETLTALFVSE